MQPKKVRLCGAGAAILVCLGCGAGNVAFKQGRKAELRKDYDTALINYEKAVQAQPENAHFLIHEKVARTQASLSHLKRGRHLLSEGRQDEAAGEFQKAVSIDPTNEAAAQELARLLAAQAAAKRARETAIQKALKAEEEAVPLAGIQLKPLPGEPVGHLFVSADSRKVYETLGKLAGLNVAFHSDFQPKPVTLDLTNVKIEEGLHILAYQTKTFWKPVTPNTILVIPDTAANRRDYEDEVLKTVYLTSPLAPADRTAIVTALKQVLLLQRLVDNADSNAIIIRDTAEKVAAAEKLIRDLDHGKAEVLIDVAVVEADRNRMRDLGLTHVPAPPLPPTGVAAIGFTPSTTVTSSSSTSTIPSLPLNRLGHISTADFSIVLPGALANALLNDSRTRILQNPQVRVTDSQTAKLRIGTRVPFATGSFLPSLGGIAGGGGGGGLGVGLLASTQFQFQDVGVNLDLTPHVLATGEVSLHAVIEISSLGAPVSFGGGLQEPTFNQRKIEHDIRLKEGEVNLLGGLIQSTETMTVTGLPGLSQIPLMRHLFSSEHRERIETEVLVMLTPHLIRMSGLRAESRKGVTMGGAAVGPTPEVPPPPEAPPQQPQ